MPIVALASTIASIFISTNYSLCCIALLSLCLSTKQQHNSNLNNFQYFIIKLSLLILLQISLQLNNGSSHLMVLIPTTTNNTIHITNATCNILTIIKCIINLHLNIRLSTLHHTFITLFINKTTTQFLLKQLAIFLYQITFLSK